MAAKLARLEERDRSSDIRRESDDSRPTRRNSGSRQRRHRFCLSCSHSWAVTGDGTPTAGEYGAGLPGSLLLAKLTARGLLGCLPSTIICASANEPALQTPVRLPSTATNKSATDTQERPRTHVSPKSHASRFRQHFRAWPSFSQFTSSSSRRHTHATRTDHRTPGRTP